MVGGLADWFAVTALFREIPLARSKTAIIPRNKQRIADNLGRFVEEKFLSTDSLLTLIRRHDPSQKLASWLSDPHSAERLSQLVRQLVSGFLKAAAAADYLGRGSSEHPGHQSQTRRWPRYFLGQDHRHLGGIPRQRPLTGIR